MHSEPPLDEEWPSAQLDTDASWSEVHSGELISLHSGADRLARPCFQDSQPSTLSFSPLRRGPLFTEHLEASLRPPGTLQCGGPRPAPKARPSAWKHHTSRPKSLHVRSSRDSLCSRPRPSPPALRASGLTTSGYPKSRPRPPQRGHYAAYPSEVSRQLASEQGAISKAASPCTTQESCTPLLPQATVPFRKVGGLPVKRGLQSSESPLESGPKKTVKQSSRHSGQWSKALTLWKELCTLTSCISALLREVLASSNSGALLEQLLRPLRPPGTLQCGGPRPAPKARPSAWKHHTSRPKSLHVHSSRDSLCSRPRPSPPALRASGLTTSGYPKSRPRPPQRGHYAAYPSEVSRQLASEQGAISKAASPCTTQESCTPLLPQATVPFRKVGGLPVKRGLQSSGSPP